jgi:hypothetical protein
VNEYNLTIAFDVSTATYTQNFLINSEESFAQSMAFNSDGTKMYIIGHSGDDVNEYSLATAFDVSSATYIQSFAIATQDTVPRGLTFNNDGSKMFILGDTDNDVNEYNLTIAFDVSTATYAQNFSTATEEDSPQEIVFNRDGTKMFVIGSTGDAVYQYNLTTGFDVSTATYVQNISVDDGNPTGLAFNNDGTKLFVVGSSGDRVYEYNIDSPAVQSVAQNSAITNITFNTTGAAGIGTATNLPDGVTASWSNNVLTISGTPTVSGTFNYAIPLTAACGSEVVTGTITVLGDNDGDGIPDVTDLDNDNDGILDTDECYTSIIEDGSFEAISPTAVGQAGMLPNWFNLNEGSPDLME